MAFSYNTATTAAGYMAGIAGWLPSQTGWSLEAQWTSGTTVCDVYKSAAATNGNIDFYVYVMRQTSSTTLIHFLLSEAYDNSAKTATYIMQAENNTAGSYAAYTTDSSCRNPGTYSLTATSGNTAPNWVRFDITGLSQWGCHAFDDGVWFTGKTATSTGFYFHAGYFNSLVYNPSTNDPVPLGAMWNGIKSGTLFLWPNGKGGASGTNDASTAAFTRWAMHPSTSTGSNDALYYNGHGLTACSAVITGFPYQNYMWVPNSPYFDLYQSATPKGAVTLPYLLSVFSQGVTSDPPAYGIIRGRCKNVVATSTSLSAAWGDTIEVDGATYRYLGNTTIYGNYDGTAAGVVYSSIYNDSLWVKE